MSWKKVVPLMLSLVWLSGCVKDESQQPYMGASPQQGNVSGTDLYNANKNVQKPQSTNWGWTSNQF